MGRLHRNLYVMLEFSKRPKTPGITGIILETEGSVQKILKRALFHYKKVKKCTPNLTSPYVHILFTIVLIKQIFEKISHQRQRLGVRLSFSLK